MLVRDARYYCFRGVEQGLVRCRVSSFLDSGEVEGGGSGVVREEIEIGLEDVRVSGVSFVEGVREDGGGDGGSNSSIHRVAHRLGHA